MHIHVPPSNLHTKILGTNGRIKHNLRKMCVNIISHLWQFWHLLRPLLTFLYNHMGGTACTIFNLRTEAWKLPSILLQIEFTWHVRNHSKTHISYKRHASTWLSLNLHSIYSSPQVVRSNVRTGALQCYHAVWTKTKTRQNDTHINLGHIIGGTMNAHWGTIEWGWGWLGVASTLKVPRDFKRSRLLF